MKFNANKLKELSCPISKYERDEMESRKQNRDWLAISERLALKIRKIIRKQGLSQNNLAEKLNVSPAQITKILSGKENLGIKTISKIEKALGENLIEIPFDEERPYVKLTLHNSVGIHQSRKSVHKGMYSSITPHNILS